MHRNLVICCCICIFSGCQSQKKVQSAVPEEQKVVIPDDMTISPDIGPAVRDVQIQWFEKGKTLYKIHCGDCHGIFTKGKDGVPNFTKIQIDTYNASVLANKDEHQMMKKMSLEQFNYVMAYLRLRKIQ